MGLREYVVKRIANLIGLYFAFIAILFVMFRMMPGDPTSMYTLQGMTAEQQQAMRERLGLDLPLHEQFIKYVSDLLGGSLGQSHLFREPVAGILSVKLMNTIFLMGAGMFLAYAVGILFGAYLGWNRGSKSEKTGIIFVLMARSSPSFWVGILLLLVFAIELGWFPTGGMRTPGTVNVGAPGLSKFLAWDYVHHMILPMVTSAIVWASTPTLLMRNTILDILNEDFIEIKKANGFSEFVILYRHAVRNSLLPLVTIASVSVGYALGGSVVIETVFNWPGMGRAMVNALLGRDYALAQGAFFFMGSIVIFMNFVADMLYLKLDPRVVYDS